MKHITFEVSCSFTMQYTFTEQEVQQDEEGNEGDVAPMDAAISQLEKELKEYIGNAYPDVCNVEVYTDAGDILGVYDDVTDTISMLGLTNGGDTMKNFTSYLKDIDIFAKALDSIQMRPKEKADLGEFYMSKHGILVTRDKGMRVRGDTVYSCSQIGKYLTEYFDGTRPGDLMMWIGLIERQSDGSELWIMRPEVRLAINKLRWF